MGESDRTRLVVQGAVMAAGCAGALLGYVFLRGLLEPVVWAGWAGILATIAGAAGGALAVGLPLKLLLGR